MKFLHEIILSSSSKHGSPEILETGLGFAPSFFINGRPNVSVGDAHINVDAEDDVSKIEEGGRKRERERSMDSKGGGGTLEFVLYHWTALPHFL